MVQRPDRPWPKRARDRRRGSLYHRVLQLRHYRPKPVMTFILFEGSVILAVLLSLAEIVDWWSVLVLPVAVAALVKFNDMIAGLTRHRYATVDPQQHPNDE